MNLFILWALWAFVNDFSPKTCEALSGIIDLEQLVPQLVRHGDAGKVEQERAEKAACLLLGVRVTGRPRGSPPPPAFPRQGGSHRMVANPTEWGHSSLGV